MCWQKMLSIAESMSTKLEHIGLTTKSDGGQTQPAPCHSQCIYVHTCQYCTCMSRQAVLSKANLLSGKQKSSAGCCAYH